MAFITGLDEIKREIDILKQLDHTNVMKIFEVIDSPDCNKIYLVMPIADYG